MTEIQRKALRAMSSRNIGAVNVRGNWIWPNDIRNNAELALIVVEYFEARHV